MERIHVAEHIVRDTIDAAIETVTHIKPPVYDKIVLCGCKQCKCVDRLIRAKRTIMEED